MYSRRRVLETGAVLLSGWVAGCSIGGQSPTAGRVAWISLTNDSEEGHEVRVTVDEDDSTKFFETYRLGTDQDTANAYVETPVSGAGQYDVQATTTDQVASVSIPQWVAGDEQCVGVRFRITTAGNLVWDTKSMQEC